MDQPSQSNYFKDSRAPSGLKGGQVIHNLSTDMIGLNKAREEASKMSFNIAPEKMTMLQTTYSGTNDQTTI